MIHVLSTWGAPFPLQIIGLIVYFAISFGIIGPLLQLFSIAMPIYVIYFLILRPIFSKNVRTACIKWYKYYVKRYYMIYALIVAFGISMAIYNNFGGKGVISNKLRELGVSEMIVSLVSWFPFLIVLLVYLFWWTGGFPFKNALTMLKDEDSPPSKSDM